MSTFVILSAPRVCPPDYTPCALEHLQATDERDALMRATLPTGALINRRGTQATDGRRVYSAVRVVTVEVL